MMQLLIDETQKTKRHLELLIHQLDVCPVYNKAA